MTDHHDPFEDLAFPIERQDPRSRFARNLRARLVDALDLQPTTVHLPERKTMSSTSTTTTTATTAATAVTPYLTAHDAAAALDWYADAFGAVEQMRIVGDDGIVGHAEFHIGQAVFYLSDEHPDLGVVSPQTLGGTATALYLQVGDVDGLFARAVAAGATGLADPEDQDHGARHGTVVDPFGHRWLLSQHVEDVDSATYAARLEDTEYALEVPGLTEGETIPAADRPGTGGGLWAGMFYRDALAGIRCLVDVFGFEEQLVVVGDDGETVVHSQIRWPEGGIVQAGTYDPDNVFTQAPGAQSLYVVTADPQSVWERCQAAGLDVIRPPEEPNHDPGGMGFSVRDVEGNIWSFGTYGIGA